MSTRHLSELGYIGFEVSDLSAWTAYAQHVLGLIVQTDPPGTTALVVDDQNHRLLLSEGPADDVAYVGWRCETQAALAAFREHLEALGVAYTPAATNELSVRMATDMVHFRDPDGNRHEAYVAQSGSAAPFVSDLVPGGFVTGQGGLGHVVFGSNDYLAAVCFAREILGMGMSDVIQQPLPNGRVLDVSFLHMNERHHSLAYSDKKGGKNLHHFMVEVARIENVGLARDRHLAHGLPVTMDLGQHPNDQMISFYGQTPSGFFVEYGWGGVKVDADGWTEGRFERMSDWGHRPAPRPPESVSHGR